MPVYGSMTRVVNNHLMTHLKMKVFQKGDFIVSEQEKALV
jgi:hypothetical protein